MSAKWHFTEIPPNVRIREPQIEKFFSSDAVTDRAEALVREGIQNSLDAKVSQQLRIRIGIHSWHDPKSTGSLSMYMEAFSAHLDACRKKIANTPSAGETNFRFMTFEDFGTSGLRGDPRQARPLDGVKNAFFNYFRGEGLSDKDEGDRGRHGVGKYTFAAASAVRAIYGLTRRADPDGSNSELLMGTSVLHIHEIAGKTYLPDGWYGIASSHAGDNGLVLPLDAPASIDAFKSLFKLARNDETGLSVVIPWLDLSVDVAAVTRAVVAGFFYPILAGDLVVEVVDEIDQVTTIDTASIRSVSESLPGLFASQMHSLLDLAESALNPDGFHTLSLPSDPGSLKWEKTCIPDSVRPTIQQALENQEAIKLIAPVIVRKKSAAGEIDHASDMKVIFRRDSSSDDGQVVFIREGLIISDVRSNNRQVRCPGVRGLVLIDDGPLATMLGDSENPAHTQWQYQLVKDKYVKAGVCINYVASSIPSILRVLSDEQKKADPSLLIDLFSLPSEIDMGPKTKQKRKKPGGGPVDPIDPPPAKPKRFRVQKLDDGFVIRAGDAQAALPPAIELKVAYDVRRGNPLAKYRPADFRLGLGPIKCKYDGCEHTDFGDNWVVVKINQPEFEIRVTGFDTRRDLHIDAKVKEQEGASDGSAN